MWNNFFKRCLTLKLTEGKKIKVETFQKSFQNFVLFKLQTKYFKMNNDNIWSTFILRKASSLSFESGLTIFEVIRILLVFRALVKHDYMAENKYLHSYFYIITKILALFFVLVFIKIGLKSSFSFLLYIRWKRQSCIRISLLFLKEWVRDLEKC